MKSYFRFLERNKAYTAVQFTGLAVSLGFVIIVFAYLVQELGKKYEFPHEDTYAVGCDGGTGLGMSYGTKDVLDAAMPEIALSSKFSLWNESVAEVGGKELKIERHSADKEFFGIFPLKFLSGSPDVLDDYSNVLLSSRFAAETFPEGDAEGRTLLIDGQAFTVAGVFEMDGDRGVLPYADVIVSIDHPVMYADYIKNPNNNFGPFSVAVRLAPGTDPEDFTAKATKVYEKTFDLAFGLFFNSARVIRLDKLYFSDSGGNYVSGNRNMLLLLSLAGAALLISAVFNYVNLNTALSGKRAKEMAVREIYGMGGKGFYLTWIKESFLFTSLCFAAGIIIAVACAPYMEQLSGIHIDLSRLLVPAGILGYLAIIAIVSCISGLIPAFSLSRISAVAIAKGEFRFRNKMVFSRLLIVIQNIISIVLICFAITMSRQMRHLMDMPVGADTEDLYFFTDFGENNLSQVLYDGFRALPCVEEVGLASGFPGFVRAGQYGTTADGKDLLYLNLNLDTVAFRMFGFDVLQEYSAMSDRSVWFSEAAMRMAGLDNETHDISLTSLDSRGGYADICGVVSDFAVSDAQRRSADDFGILVIRKTEDMLRWGGFVLKTVPDHENAGKMIEDFWRKTFSDAGLPDFTEAFNHYIDDYLSDCMDTARDNGRLVTMFMVLAVMISMLGMVSMSAFYISERAKDIALRRIYGSTVGEEMWHDMRGFMAVVLVADAVAVPLAWWLCGRYLEQFYYRVDVGAWVLAAVVLISLALTAVSVVLQTYRAVTANPVDALRKE